MQHIDVEFLECTWFVELSQRGIKTSGENDDFLDDCSQSAESELSFVQQDNGSEDCIILKPKRA